MILEHVFADDVELPAPHRWVIAPRRVPTQLRYKEERVNDAPCIDASRMSMCTTVGDGQGYMTRCTARAGAGLSWGEGPVSGERTLETILAEAKKAALSKAQQG